MKNLENYGVQSLNAKEIKGIDGGIAPSQVSLTERYDDPVTSYIVGFIVGFLGF